MLVLSWIPYQTATEATSRLAANIEVVFHPRAMTTWPPGNSPKLGMRGGRDWSLRFSHTSGVNHRGKEELTVQGNEVPREPGRQSCSLRTLCPGPCLFQDLDISYGIRSKFGPSKGVLNKIKVVFPPLSPHSVKNLCIL